MANPNDYARYLDSTGWLGIGIVGVLVFVLGIYRPALARLPQSGYLGIACAIVGGAVAVVGFSFASDRRKYERAHPRQSRPRAREREIAIAPSFEVYRPPAVPRPAPPSPGPPIDAESSEAPAREP
jgi:hypothetical protein